MTQSIAFDPLLPWPILAALALIVLVASGLALWRGLSGWLLRLAAGAVVLPPSPAFYQHPRTLDDIVDFVVSRILDALGVHNELFRRWGGRSTDEPSP